MRRSCSPGARNTETERMVQLLICLRKRQLVKGKNTLAEINHYLLKKLFFDDLKLAKRVRMFEHKK